MRRMLASVAVAVALASVAADTQAACTKDTDCKGDRICSSGSCASPRVSKGRVDASDSQPEALTSPASEQADAKRGTWYGWQIFAMDGVFTACTIGSLGWDIHANVGAIGLYFVSMGGFIFSAPIDHWAHGRVVAGFASLGVRAAIGSLEIAGGLLQDENGNVLPDVALGAMVAVTVLDGVFNSRAPAPSDGFFLTPWASGIRGGGIAGIVGIF